MATSLNTSPIYTGDKLLIFTAIYVPVQISCVALRYLSRYLVEGPWGLDDAVIMSSLVLQMCMAGLSIGIESNNHASCSTHRILISYSVCQVRWGWSPYTVLERNRPPHRGNLGEVSGGHLDSILCWCQRTKNRYPGALPAALSKQKQSSSNIRRYGISDRVNLCDDCYNPCCL